MGSSVEFLGLCSFKAGLRVCERGLLRVLQGGAVRAHGPQRRCPLRGLEGQHRAKRGEGQRREGQGQRGDEGAQRRLGHRALHRRRVPGAGHPGRGGSQQGPQLGPLLQPLAGVCAPPQLGRRRGRRPHCRDRQHHLPQGVPPPGHGAARRRPERAGLLRLCQGPEARPPGRAAKAGQADLPHAHAPLEVRARDGEAADALQHGHAPPEGVLQGVCDVRPPL
mmetsp:Transcript_107471/g.335031  ORF Transcript_107471/g.335031 Transcript_107471/m.335031 type:complete len:222 (+) Transcript_107471:489-1154(+)